MRDIIASYSIVIFLLGAWRVIHKKTEQYQRQHRCSASINIHVHHARRHGTAQEFIGKCQPFTHLLSKWEWKEIKIQFKSTHTQTRHTLFSYRKKEEERTKYNLPLEFANTNEYDEMKKTHFQIHPCAWFVKWDD